jgi:hypothetical protein
VHFSPLWPRSSAQPRVWPIVEPYYTLASAGRAVKALVWWYGGDFGASWGKRAFGSLQAYEESNGFIRGLRGRLGHAVEANDQWFEPLELEIWKGLWDPQVYGRVSVEPPGTMERVLDDLWPGPDPEWDFYAPHVPGTICLSQWYKTPPIGVTEIVNVYLYNWWVYSNAYVEPRRLIDVGNELSGTDS